MLDNEQRRALNKAIGKAQRIRNEIEDLIAPELDEGKHLELAVEVTNCLLELELALKGGKSRIAFVLKRGKKVK